MAPPVNPPTTPQPQIAATEATTTWGTKVKLRPTKYYPPMPLHLFPDENFYLSPHNNYTKHTGPASPLTIQIICSLAVGTVLFVTLCITRYHMKRRLRKYQIKGNMDEKQPLWTLQTPVITSPYINVSWHRKNMGKHVTLLTSRSIYVDLKPHFAASARPNAQGERLARNTDEITLLYEGIMSDIGFTSGRHLFAFMWPRDQRYSSDGYLAFGLGYPSIDLRGDCELLLGSNRKSMAFNVIQNELYFNYAKISAYPRRKPKDFCVPTLFYMYMDLDEGRLSFGSETEYWGAAFDFKNMRRHQNKPLHVMASFRAIRGKIMMFYKGQVSDYKEHGNSLTRLADTSNQQKKASIRTDYKVEKSLVGSCAYVYDNPSFQVDPLDSNDNNLRNAQDGKEKNESVCDTEGSNNMNSTSAGEEAMNENFPSCQLYTELSDINPQIMTVTKI